MKQILVFSDSHGDSSNMMQVIKEHPNVDMVLHMGDIQADVNRLRGQLSCALNVVRGNCDWDYDLPDFKKFHYEGKTILMTHGHRYVGFGSIDSLKYWAMEQEADIVMFGHTHVPFLEQSSNLTVLNPGSISRPRQSNHIPTYTIISIDEDEEFHYNMCEFH